MKSVLKLKTALAFLLSVFFIISCEKEGQKNLDEKKVNNSNQTIKDLPVIKEFELTHSWFNNDNLKSGSITGDIYANFGVGYDAVDNLEKNSIFNPGVSVEPLISTAVTEKTELVYVATSDYSQIDEKVASTLAASLKVTTTWVKANANLSISKSSSISSSTNSVYISVLYIKRYGRGSLQYNSSAVNNYLTYRTNLNDYQLGGKDGITINNSTFRGTFGDQFKSALTFGVILNGTIQITGVDFTGASKEEVAAQGQIAVKNMVEASASWESQKSSNSHFSKSNIIVTATAVPRTSKFIFNREDLVEQIRYMDQLYANGDFGIIANEYTPYTYLYPTYDFINYEFLAAQPLFTRWQFNNSNPFMQYLSSNGEVDKYYDKQIGRWLTKNLNSNDLKPIYYNVCQDAQLRIYCCDDVIISPPNTQSFSTLIGYVYRTQKYSNLKPLYRAIKRAYPGSIAFAQYDYYIDGVLKPGFSEPYLLGWIFPN